jgi:hypothetical protein
VLGDTLYCVNTGDSRCVVAMRSDSEVSAPGPAGLDGAHFGVDAID